MRSLWSKVTAAILTLAGVVGAYAEPTAIPDAQLDILYDYCIDCHDDVTAKADLNLDVFDVDWTDAHSREIWTDVYNRIDLGKMPPKEKPQLDPDEKKALLEWLDNKLMAHSPIGGAAIRRLNRREMEKTLKTLFPIKGFELPHGFPADNESHGFDTVSDALVISASHLEAYRDTATMIADYLFPQPRVMPEQQKLTYGLDDITISYSSGANFENAIRLASSGIPSRNAVWLSRYEARASGKYKVEITLSTKNPPEGKIPTLDLMATNLTGKSSSRDLAKFKVEPGKPKVYRAEVDLYKGETLASTYGNAPLSYGKKESYSKFLKELFTRE
ncbi:MAG: DUF1587 domain-containing protein, partial [Verrucomicrobiota bacterium]